MQINTKSITETGSMIYQDLLDKDINTLDLDWKPYTADGRKGAEIVRLYDERKNNQGPAAALMRYTPGTQVVRHTHQGYELIFVIQGTLVNDAGTHERGTLEICPPGSSHALSSDEGCIFLVIWEQPVVAH